MIFDEEEQYFLDATFCMLMMDACRNRGLMIHESFYDICLRLQKKGIIKITVEPRNYFRDFEINFPDIINSDLEELKIFYMLHQ